jgi:hypothetical protein
MIAIQTLLGRPESQPPGPVLVLALHSGTAADRVAAGAYSDAVRGADPELAKHLDGYRADWHELLDVTFDAALPQAFYDRVAGWPGCEHPLKWFVWAYPKGTLSGLPAPRTMAARDALCYHRQPFYDPVGRCIRLPPPPEAL